jgi:hypothetical protein
MLRPPAPFDAKFALDVVILLALCLSVAFFLVVMERSLTRGDLTRAELDLMRPAMPARHAIVVHARN